MTTGDILTKANEIAWVELTDGIRFRLLRTSAETGTWTVIFQCDKDASFDRHRHYGAGEYYMIKGKMEYRAGVAVAGDWGYEPLGAVHDHTVFTEPSELLFTNHGPVAYIDDDDNVTAVLDYAFLEQLVADQA